MALTQEYIDKAKPFWKWDPNPVSMGDLVAQYGANYANLKPRWDATGLSQDQLLQGTLDYFTKITNPVTNVGDVGNWWGDEAWYRVPLQGYALSNPGFNWKQYIDPAKEAAQQAQIGANLTAAQQQHGGGGLLDNPLGLAALAAGMYFGIPALGEAFGGLGAAGADAFAGGFTGDIAADSLASGMFASPAAAAGYYSAFGSPYVGDIPLASDSASWGVNQMTGGNMFDWGSENLFGFEGTPTPNLGYDLSGLQGMSSYDANGNLINLNPIEKLYSSLQNIPNFPGRDTLIRSLLSQAVGGSGSSALGNLLGAGLGMYGSNQQAKSLMDIANQARADRQPYLNASLNYLGNPDAYFAGPGKSAMDATLRGLSASVGNPIGSPTAMGIATQAGLQDWRNAVTGFGNMGLAGQDLRAGLQSNAAQANANGLNALGYGLNSALNPQPNITDIVKAMNMGGLA